MSDLPDPLTPADCDLRGLPFMPLKVMQVMQSATFGLSTGDQFKAAFALWCASWMEVPAGSLPSDDPMLEYLSRSKCWKKVKAVALRGWVLCADGRLYHAIVAANAIEAWEKRTEYRDKEDGKHERQRRWREQCKQISAQLRAMGVTPPQGATLETLRNLLETGHVDASLSTSVDGRRSTVDEKEIGKTVKRSKETVKGDVNTLSVPTGTGAEAPGPAGPERQKSAAALTKAELWGAGKSLLADAGMPAKQCGSFVGKLVADHGDEIVIDAVRTAIVQRPADPAEYLVALCRTKAGLRKQPVQWWASEASIMEKAAEVGVTANPGESMPTVKAKIEAAIANGGKPPAPPRSRIAPPAPAPEGGKSVMPEGLNLKSLIGNRERP